MTRDRYGRSAYQKQGNKSIKGVHERTKQKGRPDPYKKRRGGNQNLRRDDNHDARLEMVVCRST